MYSCVLKYHKQDVYSKDHVYTSYAYFAFSSDSQARTFINTDQINIACYSLDEKHEHLEKLFY